MDEQRQIAEDLMPNRGRREELRAGQSVAVAMTPDYVPNTGGTAISDKDSYVEAVPRGGAVVPSSYPLAYPVAGVRAGYAVTLATTNPSVEASIRSQAALTWP